MWVLVIKIPGSYTNIVTGVVMVMFSLVFPLCYLTSDVMNTGWSGFSARPSLLQHFISCSTTPAPTLTIRKFDHIHCTVKKDSKYRESWIIKSWNNRLKKMLTLVKVTQIFLSSMLTFAGHSGRIIHIFSSSLVIILTSFQFHFSRSERWIDFNLWIKLILIPRWRKSPN